MEFYKLCVWRCLPALWSARRSDFDLPRNLLTAYGPNISNFLEMILSMKPVLPLVEQNHLELDLLHLLHGEVNDGSFVLFCGLTQEHGQISVILGSMVEIEETIIRLRDVFDREAFRHLIPNDRIEGLVYIREGRVYQFIIFGGGIIPLGSLEFNEWASELESRGINESMEAVLCLALCVPDSLEDVVTEVMQNSWLPIIMTSHATDFHDFLLEYGLQRSPRLVRELTLTDMFVELTRQPEATSLGVFSTLTWLSDGMIDKLFISANIPCQTVHLIGLIDDEAQTSSRIMTTNESDPDLVLDPSEKIIESKELITHIFNLCAQQPDVEVCVITVPSEFGDYFLQAHGGLGGIMKHWIDHEEVVVSSDVPSPTEWDDETMGEEFTASVTI